MRVILYIFMFVSAFSLISCESPYKYEEDSPIPVEADTTQDIGEPPSF